MIERSTNTDHVIAVAIWTGTGALICAAWGLLFAGLWGAAILVAETACVLSAVAAVRTIRCYAIRVCGLIRNVARESGSTATDERRDPGRVTRLH